MMFSVFDNSTLGLPMPDDVYGENDPGGGSGAQEGSCPPGYRRAVQGGCIYDWQRDLDRSTWDDDPPGPGRREFVPVGRSGYDDSDVTVTTTTRPPGTKPPSDWDKKMKEFADWIEAHKTEAMIGAVAIVLLLKRK